MKNKKGLLLRLLSIICIVMVITAVIALPVSAIPEYRTGANSASSSYAGGKYYQYVMNIPLSGDGVTDVLAVALSQMGYSEGNSTSQMSGTANGGSNYTEFYYNFGMATDTWSMEWCAAFCSWALYQSRVSNQGKLNDWCRNHLGDGNYIWREISCYYWANQLQRVGRYGTRGSYTPTSGDLIFFNRSGNIGHIGLVVWCDGSTVYTIEGNTSSGSGVDGNGGGTYYKSYSLSNTGINGYGRLPYASNPSAAKVDYSGKNKTAGLYMTKADFYISPPVDAGHPIYEEIYKVPKYEMFKVTGFTTGIDGVSYAIIEHGEGRYYGKLNANTIQITAQGHTHEWEAGNDGTHHYQICSSCGEKKDVAEHSFTTEYNGTQHWQKCSCQYTKDTANHTLGYVIEGDTHKQVCSCGYVLDGSHVAHTYDIMESDDATHYYRCACGQIDSENVEPHVFASTYDSENHYDVCEICDKVLEGSVEKHKFSISTNYQKCECGYDRHDVDDEHSWVISYQGDTHYQQCEDCGEIRPDTEETHIYSQYYIEGAYHYQACICGYVAVNTKAEHVYDRQGYSDANPTVHLDMCVCGKLIEGTEEAHYYERLEKDERGHWYECVCGFKSEVTDHTFNNGTCSECAYHEHQYSYDLEGHWMTCGCYGSRYFEKHILENGECTVCKYKKTSDHEHVMDGDTCTECGYHQHRYVYDEKGHWRGCECYSSANLEEHVLVNGKCSACGYDSSKKVLHNIVDGDCVDCGYHEHLYLYDANGHKNICECYLNSKIEKHTLDKNGRCTVCGYDSKDDALSDDGKIEELFNGDSVLNVGASGAGCKSSLGTATAILGTVLVLGCGFVFRKKED